MTSEVLGEGDPLACLDTSIAPSVLCLAGVRWHARLPFMHVGGSTWVLLGTTSSASLEDVGPVLAVCSFQSLAPISLANRLSWLAWV